jgi:hypothetical protein
MCILAILLLLPAIAHAGKSAQTDSFEVIPGRRIGQIHLHEMLGAVLKRFGPAAYGDSALGHHWCTWQVGSAVSHTGSRHDLDVYASVNETNGPYVRIVRVTSPRFRTANGIACGSTLAQIQHRYPKAHRIARYLSPQFHKPVVIFDAASQGIAFEVVCDKGRQTGPASPCVALLVHVAGKHSVQDEYYSLTSYEISKPIPVLPPIKTR